MKRGRSVLVTLVTMSLVAIGWSGVSADGRRPIGANDLWPGEVSGIAIDARGDVYVAGSCCYKRTEHMTVRRYARGGGLVWERTFRRTGDRFTRGRDVTVAADGTVYVVGSLSLGERIYEGFPTVGTFLRAYGPGGSLRWQRVYSIDGYVDPVPTAVAAGPGFVVVTGYDTSFESEAHEGWVRAWSPGGRLLWVDDFEFRGIDVAKRDMPTDVAVDRDGSIYVVGVVERLEDEYGGADPDDAEVVVRRIASTGRTVWTRVLTDRSTDRDVATSVAVHGGRVLVGALFGQARGRMPGHPWVRSFTTAGHAVWTRVWPRGADFYEDLAVALDPFGRAYVGWSGSHGVHVKALTTRGWLRWTSSTTASGRLDLVAVRDLVRLVGQGRAVARLYTFRA